MPEAWWVVSLWREHKLEHDQYMDLSIRLRDGHDRRKANCEIVAAAEAAQSYRAERELAFQMLAKKAKPFKPWPPAVEAWKMHYEELDDRYKLLVLHGPSRTGKSRMARDIFGSSSTFVVDIQHAAHPDLKGFLRHQHKALLLDEMQSPEFIAQNKKVLQAHVDGALLGQSSTQMFTYELFWCRVPFIITTNNWCLDSLCAADRNWVKENCVEVLIDSPVWQESQATSCSFAPATPRKRGVQERSPQPSPQHKIASMCCPACGQRLPIQ